MAFAWTTDRYLAACAIFEAGGWPNGLEAAARAAGRDVRTIERWYKNQPIFRDAVDGMTAEKCDDLRAFTVGRSVADKAERIRWADDQWRRITGLCQIAAANLEDAIESGNVEKTRAFHQVMQLVRTGMDLMRHAAVELGQWQEKTEINYAQLTDEQLLHLLTASDSANQGGSGAAGAAEEPGA